MELHTDTDLDADGRPYPAGLDSAGRADWDAQIAAGLVPAVVGDGAQPISDVAMHAAAGLTPREIAVATGLAIAGVLAHPDCPRTVGAALAARVELAVADRALGVTTRTVRTDPDGVETVTETEHPPDAGAAKTLLAARMPAAYGAQAGGDATVVVLHLGNDGQWVRPSGATIEHASATPLPWPRDA